MSPNQDQRTTHVNLPLLFFFGNNCCTYFSSNFTFIDIQFIAIPIVWRNILFIVFLFRSNLLARRKKIIVYKHIKEFASAVNIDDLEPGALAIQSWQTYGPLFRPPNSKATEIYRYCMYCGVLAKWVFCFTIYCFYGPLHALLYPKMLVPSCILI